MRIIVSSIGTEEGKTWTARGIARALINQGRTVAALKPLETGVVTVASDARALERACRVSAMTFESPSFFRATEPVSPYAASLSLQTASGSHVFVDMADLRSAVRSFDKEHEIILIESAGGLFVPLTRSHVFIDLVEPSDVVLVVAMNRLGVLSHVLGAARAAKKHVPPIELAAVLLIEPRVPDASTATNDRVLRDHGLTTYRLRQGKDDDDDLAALVTDSGIIDSILTHQPSRMTAASLASEPV